MPVWFSTQCDVKIVGPIRIYAFVNADDFEQRRRVGQHPAVLENYGRFVVQFFRLGKRAFAATGHGDRARQAKRQQKPDYTDAPKNHTLI